MNAISTNSNVTSKISKDPHYAAATKEGWGVDFLGIEAQDGSDANYAGILGLAMTNFTIEAEGIKKARVRNKRGKWLDYKTGFGMNNVEGLGDGTDIIGFEIVGSGFIVGVHCKGGQWLNAIKTSDVEGEVIVGIGTPIDAIWIEKA